VSGSPRANQHNSILFELLGKHREHLLRGFFYHVKRRQPSSNPKRDSLPDVMVEDCQIVAAVASG
jgi:hypothetical protein